jgi:hypothetical protein
MLAFVRIKLHKACTGPTVDPASSISFPNKLQISSKTPLPEMTLVGVGVRTVSFLGIKVYSVGFYADLQNPKLNVSATCVCGSIHTLMRLP